MIGLGEILAESWRFLLIFAPLVSRNHDTSPTTILKIRYITNNLAITIEITKKRIVEVYNLISSPGNNLV